MTTQPPVSAGDGNYVGDKSLLSLLLKSSDQFMVDEGCDDEPLPPSGCRHAPDAPLAWTLTLLALRRRNPLEST